MTTTEEALTVACPECGKPPGEMCILTTQAYVETGWGNAPNRGRGYGDASQIGRTAKRPHNGRRAEFYWTHLPERVETLQWGRPQRHGRIMYTVCGWYGVYLPTSWGDTLTGSSYDAFARNEHARWHRMEIGAFPTLEAAQQRCAEHNEAKRAGLCDCDGCVTGLCCGIGNCPCTPEVTRRLAADLGIDLDTNVYENAVRKILGVTE